MNKRALVIVCGGCSSMTASLPLLLKHFRPEISDATQGVAMGIPLGVALTALICFLKRGSPDEA